MRTDGGVEARRVRVELGVVGEAPEASTSRRFVEHEEVRALREACRRAVSGDVEESVDQVRVDRSVLNTCTMRRLRTTSRNSICPTVPTRWTAAIDSNRPRASVGFDRPEVETVSAMRRESTSRGCRSAQRKSMRITRRRPPATDGCSRDGTVPETPIGRGRVRERWQAIRRGDAGIRWTWVRVRADYDDEDPDGGSNMADHGDLGCLADPVAQRLLASTIPAAGLRVDSRHAAGGADLVPLGWPTSGARHTTAGTEAACPR